jgi:hypothetical protein
LTSRFLALMKTRRLLTPDYRDPEPFRSLQRVGQDHPKEHLAQQQHLRCFYDSQSGNLTRPRRLMKVLGSEAVLEIAMVRWFERALGATVEEVQIELVTLEAASTFKLNKMAGVVLKDLKT